MLQKQDKRTQYSIVIKDPSGIDVILQPREVAYLPVFPASSKSSDGQPVGWIIAEGLLKDPRQTLVVHLRIPASTGAWTGDLRTGDTPGSALNAAPPR